MQKINENRRYRLAFAVKSIGSSVKNISLKYLSRIDEIQQSLANPKKRNIGDIYSGNAKITSASQLQPGNIIEIKLNGGVVRAEVKDIKLQN